MDKLEWLNDASALEMMSASPGVKGQVGVGFWKIYQSMAYGNLAGVMENGDVAARIAALAAGGAYPNVFVCGHSLGAALATYLAYDLNAALGDQAGRLRPYFFASPMTGTSDWVNWYQRQLVRYALSNYALNFVPKVPPDGATLNPGGIDHNVHIIEARAPGALDTGAFAPFDWTENHSPIGYALMLDGTNPVACSIEGGRCLTGGSRDRGRDAARSARRDRRGPDS